MTRDMISLMMLINDNSIYFEMVGITYTVHLIYHEIFKLCSIAPYPGLL